MSNVLLNQVEQGKQKISQSHPPPIVLLRCLLHFQGTWLLAKTCLSTGTFQKHSGQFIIQLPHQTLPISGSRYETTQSDKIVLLLGLFSPHNCTYGKVKQKNRASEQVTTVTKGEMHEHLLNKRMSRECIGPVNPQNSDQACFSEICDSCCVLEQQRIQLGKEISCSRETLH